jgi:hypothetical protein
MGVLVFGTIDFKFEGAGILRDIGRVHPSGVSDFLGRVFRVKGEFDPHFVSLIKSLAARSLVAEVEAVIHSRARIDFDLKIAGVAGKDFTVGSDVGKKSSSGPVRRR